MPHWIVLPVVIPILSAMLCLFLDKYRNAKRMVGLIAIVALIGVAIFMLTVANTGAYSVYAIGNWPTPFGIVFVLDRLSAMMVLLTNILALFAYLYAITGPDKRGPYFHFLFLMEITGVNGAFLTGDLFNLFVCFEILLLSAYVLVVYGGGPARTRTGIQYVVLNLIGSALFLIAVGVLYAITGTLNMADMAVKAAEVGGSNATLLRASSYLILVVFCVKAALFPLYFWLPHSYAAATAPVAALFAIMTKVGVYAILRSTTLIFGEGQGYVENLMEPILLPAALLTLVLGVAGVLGAEKLRTLVAYMVIGSVGTILAGIGLYTIESIAGSLYYMVHSTLISGALFLIADLVVQQRGNVWLDRLEAGPQVREPVLIGMLFFIAMIAAAGLPPLTGFLGKVLILDAAIDTPWHAHVWTVIIITSFLSLVAVSRAGSNLFWKTEEPIEGKWSSVRVKSLPIIGILLTLIAMVVFAGPIVDYTSLTAEQLLNPEGYIHAVLGGLP